MITFLIKIIHIIVAIITIINSEPTKHSTVANYNTVGKGGFAYSQYDGVSLTRSKASHIHSFNVHGDSMGGYSQIKEETILSLGWTIFEHCFRIKGKNPMIN